MQCRRCGGSGELSNKLGKPDPDRDTHKPYLGPWCIYPPHRCPVCRGTGSERDKPPPPPYRGPINIPNPDDIALWF